MYKVVFLFVVSQQPANTKFCFKLGKTATEAPKVVETVYRNEALSHTHVYFTEHSHDTTP
jgi:hypothetical protein